MVQVGVESGSGSKSTGCFSRGPRFDSQQPHCSSQSSVNPGLSDLGPSFSLRWHQACIQPTRMHASETHVCIMVVLNYASVLALGVLMLDWLGQSDTFIRRSPSASEVLEEQREGGGKKQIGPVRKKTEEEVPYGPRSFIHSILHPICQYHGTSLCPGNKTMNGTVFVFSDSSQIQVESHMTTSVHAV